MLGLLETAGADIDDLGYAERQRRVLQTRSGGRSASAACALAHQRADVGERPEVLQLVGIDDRSDHLHYAVGDVHAEDVDQPPVRVEDQGAGLTVDLRRGITTFS